MKRVSTDTIIDLTGNSSQEDEPEIKKKKVEEDEPEIKKKKVEENDLENHQKKDETVKEGAAEGTSIDLTNTDDEETDEDIKNANFSCRKCEFSCDTLNEYQTHNYTNHNNESGDVSDKLFCKACNVRSFNEQGFKDHLNGAKHKKKGQTINSWFCEHCKVQTTSQVTFDEHLKGARHAKNIKSKNDEGNFYCDICKLRFGKKTLFEAHMGGQPHQRRVKMTQQQNVVTQKGASPRPPPLPTSPAPPQPPLPPLLSPRPGGNMRVGGLGQSGRENSTGNTSGFMNFPSPDVFSHPSAPFRQKLRPDPENFHNVAKMLATPIDMEFAMQGAGKWSRLTREIVRMFNCRQQLMETMKQKIALWSEIYRAVRTDFDCGISVFGSTFNGFGAEGCDIDMCLFPQGPAMADKQWLSKVRGLLSRHCGHFIKGRIELINAKVPILKFFDRAGKLEVDISVNNPTSIRNTHMLFCYSQCDYRVRPMVMAVKLWAKEHGINEARFQTMSSYALTLMVLHYLQSAVFPPVLPCLQEELPNIFNPNSIIFDLPYTPPPWVSRNRQSLGELLLGFFSYYSGGPRNFDCNKDVASVRKGMVLEQRDCEAFARMNKLSPGQWNARILIEEPFDRTNAARAVCNDQKWGLIVEAFLYTRDVMERGGPNLGLDDLRPRRNPRC